VLVNIWVARFDGQAWRLGQATFLILVSSSNSASVS
jgi:hypothetical protein